MQEFLKTLLLTLVIYLYIPLILCVCSHATCEKQLNFLLFNHYHEYILSKWEILLSQGNFPVFLVCWNLFSDLIPHVVKWTLLLAVSSGKGIVPTDKGSPQP
jgi:ACR3 family arsenite efflux pump ArsB